MLEEMLVMLKTLSSEASDRHWKINACVETMQRKHFGLKRRVELLKAYGKSDDEDTCPEPPMTLSELKSCVEELSDTLEEVEGYVHPCCGPSWRQVVHLNMNDPNQQCPDPWTESGGPLDIRFCVLLTASFPVAESV